MLAETRAQANRLANADAGNLRRHARAAEEQLAAIEALGGVDELPGGLRVVAELRVAHPEATLSELAELSSPTADARDASQDACDGSSSVPTTRGDPKPPKQRESEGMRGGVPAA